MHSGCSCWCFVDVLHFVAASAVRAGSMGIGDEDLRQCASWMRSVGWQRCIERDWFLRTPVPRSRLPSEGMQVRESGWTEAEVFDWNKSLQLIS